MEIGVESPGDSLDRRFVRGVDVDVHAVDSRGMKDALPIRYVVDRKGTPDPIDSEYYVLEIVHDPAARVLLRRLVRDYRSHGQHVRAEELAKALDETAEAHIQALQRLAPKGTWPAKKGRQRSRS